MTSVASSEQGSDQSAQEYITVMIADQLFGLPILEVQDVFMPEAITEVPTATQDVAGVLNLRGRIVTAIDMRKRLGLPDLEDDRSRMAVGIESNGESYGLIIDSVGEVHRLSDETFEANPANLDPRWAAISAGVHRLDGSLMVVVDVEKVLAQEETVIAA
ncbi:MAG: chemotaxis protein CheW [Hyphomicrobiaceae bacterium]|nr:chemotaxis protein CheW [Hyphomicrobiaceae bacterium]